MSCEDFRGFSSQACHLCQLCSLLIPRQTWRLQMSLSLVRDHQWTPATLLIRLVHLKGFMGSLGAEPHLTSCPPSRLNRLLCGSLTLSESVSENGSEDDGSSGSPSSNVTIMPPPGLSHDISEVAKVYPEPRLHGSRTRYRQSLPVGPSTICICSC